MEGFLDIRLTPALRALLTRCIAIVPAMLAVAWYGNAGAGALLVFSQVVLSMQLPFAVFPLLWFTTRRKHLGAFAFGWGMTVLLWGAALLIVALNVWMLQRLMLS
jgi:manganese transport protein